MIAQTNELEWTLPPDLAGHLVDDRRPFAQRRLTRVYEDAYEVPFDNASRVVFFSDCHRGDRSGADAFVQNEAVFTHALTHYYQHGFTYIEVGDGDELWQNRRASDVIRAYRRIYDLLHTFDADERLHLIVGNHDVQQRPLNRVEKEGLVAREGLILRHVQTGQQLFVFHGHQVDSYSEQLRLVGRTMARSWRRIQDMGVRNDAVWMGTSRKWRAMRGGVSRYQQMRTHNIERQIMAWAQTDRRTVICAHTHQAAFPTGGTPSYFNTGSCVRPGGITGIEISDGEIRLVKWSDGEGRYPRRELVAASRALGTLN
ncbi:MAG: serine/threonine protein phosphatase [Anaerolineae bacterium]|nr:serine/threonine protein phosphatase [Anaerolineae bacterium]